MALPTLWRWKRGHEVPVRRNDVGSQPMADLYSEVNRLFDDFFQDVGVGFPRTGIGMGGLNPFEPRIDVEELRDEIRITAELPGLEEKDFDVSLEHDCLTLRGEKREERSTDQDGWSHRERVYGSFTRRIPLPCAIEADKVSAHFRKGVLTVSLPKTEDARRSKIEIPVNASGK